MLVRPQSGAHLRVLSNGRLDWRGPPDPLYSGMPAYRKTLTELQQELIEQLQALRDSATAYDAGKLWEAKRLAATAYILLHDSGQKSLLNRLNLRRSIQFVSTVKPPQVGSPLPLAMIEGNAFTGSVTYAPFLEQQSTHRRDLKFSSWYHEPVFVLDSGKELSRKNLIYALRNQMGGGHVDGVVTDEAVNWLKAGPHVMSASPWLDQHGNPAVDVPFATNHHSGPIPNGHWATMRQIAWELDFSFARCGR